MRALRTPFTLALVLVVAGCVTINDQAPEDEA